MYARVRFQVYLEIRSLTRLEIIKVNRLTIEKNLYTNILELN